MAYPGHLSRLWSTKTFHRERPDIGKRRLPGHHFRQEPGGRGSERQAAVLMAEIEPEARMARRPADYRQHVRQTGPRAFPGVGVERVAEREQVSRPRHRLVDLHRPRWGVPIRELDAG